jgi:hypothetical protein
MGYALPEEAQCPAVHRTGTAQARVYPQIPNRAETAHRSGGVAVGFAFGIFFFRAFSGRIWDGKSMTDELVDRFPIDDLPERLMTNAAWLIPMALSMDRDRAAGFAVQEIAA